MNDEDIKILENYIYNKKDTMKEQLVQAIENLLKENEKLKTMLKNRIKYTNELEQDLFENASNYVISKSRIKEKIEELEKYIYKGENAPQDFLQYRIKVKIQVLQELLEENR